MSDERIDPAVGFKHWRSNPAGAVKIWRAEGEPNHGVWQREHADGSLDGRVGGTYVDPETEERYARGLIVVTRANGQTMTNAEFRLLAEAAKAAWRADPRNPQIRAAWKRIAHERSAIREQLRKTDPRRNGGVR